MKHLRKEPWQRGPLAWMTYNRVAPNLLMVVLLLGGLLVSGQIKKEVFPDFELDRVSVSVAYPRLQPGRSRAGDHPGRRRGGPRHRRHQGDDLESVRGSWIDPHRTACGL